MENPSPAQHSVPNVEDFILLIDVPVVVRYEEQLKEIPYPEGTLTKGRKVAIAVFLILCNTVLVRLLNQLYNGTGLLLRYQSSFSGHNAATGHGAAPNRSHARRLRIDRALMRNLSFETLVQLTFFHELELNLRQEGLDYKFSSRKC